MGRGFTKLHLSFDNRPIPILHFSLLSLGENLAVNGGCDGYEFGRVNLLVFCIEKRVLATDFGNRSFVS